MELAPFKVRCEFDLVSNTAYSILAPEHSRPNRTTGMKLIKAEMRNQKFDVALSQGQLYILIL